MHATKNLSDELAAYRDRFAEIRDEAAALIDECSADTFNAAPDPGRWSVGQCFEHLIKAGDPLAYAIDEALTKAETQGPYGDSPFAYGLVSRLFIWSLQPDAPISMPAPGSYTPDDKPLDPAAVRASFVDLQDRFIHCIERAPGLDIARIKVGSPAMSWFRLPVGAWFAATAAHEQRHLQQAERALNAVQSSTS